MAGVYIHIPFCNQACHYCDFHFSTNQEIVNELCDAIAVEIQLQKGYLKSPIETIYFGGGTPSIISEKNLDLIINSIQRNFSTSNLSEITLEANPEDISPEKLKQWMQLGINRLSIGIQTFQPAVLKFLNRSHNDLQAKQAIHLAREFGFNNINADLIYAIPDRDDGMLRSDLMTMIDLMPDHISAYSLTIEDKTAFGKWVKTKKISAASEEMNARQFEFVMQTLVAAGYQHYEISNYAKPKFEAVHNGNYWKRKHYLGVGPSAHSYNGTFRQFNVANNHTYLKSIQSGIIPATKEELTLTNQINEYIMTSLRTSWGCDLNLIKQELNYDLLNNQSSVIKKSIDNGLMKIENEKLLLTNRGKLYADKLSADLFVIE